MNHMVILNLNINSLLPNDLKVFATGIPKILIMTETKSNRKFLVSQFDMDKFSEVYKLRRVKDEGGLLIHITEVYQKQ